MSRVHDEFLALVDELRKRGASTVAWDGYSATFFAPYAEPEVVLTKEETAEQRRLSLNENEREELARLRAAESRFAELGVD